MYLCMKYQNSDARALMAACIFMKEHGVMNEDITKDYFNSSARQRTDILEQAVQDLSVYQEGYRPK